MADPFNPEGMLPAADWLKISVSGRSGFGLDIDDDPPIVTQL
jgi:hypothetical protein